MKWSILSVPVDVLSTLARVSTVLRFLYDGRHGIFFHVIFLNLMIFASALSGFLHFRNTLSWTRRFEAEGVQDRRVPPETSTWNYYYELRIFDLASRTVLYKRIPGDVLEVRDKHRLLPTKADNESSHRTQWERPRSPIPRWQPCVKKYCSGLSNHGKSPFFAASWASYFATWACITRRESTAASVWWATEAAHLKLSTTFVQEG